MGIAVGPEATRRGISRVALGERTMAGSGRPTPRERLTVKRRLLAALIAFCEPHRVTQPGNGN